MNSKERHEARYQRRRLRREWNAFMRNHSVGTAPEVFSFNALFQAGQECCKGVRWKTSTQNFEHHLLSKTAAQRKKLLTGTWKPQRAFHFTVKERGKARGIDAPHIADRPTHKVLTRLVLYPLYEPSMIYDNGASQIGKGLSFSFRRLKQQLAWHYRRYGRSGSVLLIDYRHFFPDAPHETIRKRHERHIQDEGLRDIAEHIIPRDADRGMPLGVEPSQIEMVSLPSRIDNYLKCQLSLHGCGHYMDDYIALLPPDVDAKAVLATVQRMAAEDGLTVNLNKTKIIPLTKPFKYCKAKFRLTETGRILVNGNRDGMKRFRKKMRKFHDMKRFDLMEQAARCQIEYYSNYNDHGRVLRVRRIFWRYYHAL